MRLERSRAPFYTEAMRLLLSLGLASMAAFLPLAAGDPVVRLVQFDGVITPISAMRIIQAIDDAESQGDNLVLIELDTPGGLVASMEKIVKRMLSAELPIVVWVGPAGARAASAGFFVLLSADVAAMAPGTRTGAASTVYGMGSESTEGDVSLKKSNEDLAALIRSIAERRGRNPQASEQAVFAAKAYEESVALEKRLIDLLAGDRDDLMQQLQGREVTLFDGTSVTLETLNARFVTSEFSFQHRFIEFLSTPALAAVLLLLGMLGIYTEITNPGVILPGVVGVLCLLLFALAAQVLPVSAIGLLLILLAVVMFILEVKVASYGMLTLGATISLVIGAIMLIDGPIPELRVPLIVILPVSLTIALLCGIAMWAAIRAQTVRVATGVEGLSAEIGLVTRALNPDGKVLIHGEIWNATAGQGEIAEGTRVRVVRVDDLHLTVRPEDSPVS